MSAFHRIRDISVMRSSVFLRLALRLGAYDGAVAARHRAAAGRGQQPQATAAASRRRLPSRYDERSPLANSARTAEGAPPATAASLAMLNAELGANWFSYKTVPAGGETA